MSTTEQRVAVVTGGARGIGAATAVRLAAEGRAVAVIDLDEAACKDNRGEDHRGRRQGPRVGADVSDEAQVEAAIARNRRRARRADDPRQQRRACSATTCSSR